jgi:signal transduction histidine kinase/CheY-like chemotaxis protein
MRSSCGSASNGRVMMSDVLFDRASVQAAVTQWFAEETLQGFFATDSTFRVVVWNRWMELHSGHAASDVVGRSIFEIYPDAIERGVKEYYENALAGRVTVISHGLHRYLLPLRPTNADLALSEMPQSGQIGPLSCSGTVIMGTVTILEDVSERLATEAQLRKQIAAQRQARDTAEKALRAKEEFLSTLSHELRSPLSAVLGWARVLLARDEIDPALVERGLHVIERNASAQAKLIDDMLDMARIAAGKVRLEVRPIDLASVMFAAVDVVMPAANAKGISIKTSVSTKTRRVNGDPDRLQQVIWNLLSNALKFTESGGAVDVGLEAAGPMARVVVRDTGHGISPEFLPFVFDRFRQNDASSTRRYGGLGLGLALARELVELHGGTVSATSEGLDRGATFTIELPMIVSAESSNMERHATHNKASASLAGIRVLVVEDEPDARDLAVIALEHSGAQVTAVPSSADGVSAILASPHALPHVLISDIGMPTENGYDFIRRVRSLTPGQGGTIPAVSVTGYASPEDVSRALAAGYQVHVAKPMDPIELIATVAELVRSGPAVVKTR